MESQTNRVEFENYMEITLKRWNHTHEEGTQQLDPKTVPFLLLAQKFYESFLDQSA